MKTSRLAAFVLLAVGVAMAIASVTMGERVIIDAMDDGRPIIGRPTNKPLLAAGGILSAASILAFGFSLIGGPQSPAGTSPPSPEAPGMGSEPSDTEK